MLMFLLTTGLNQQFFFIILLIGLFSLNKSAIIII